ncbi:Crotonobetainyl-CoA:carnitine CoA-transferase CaiB [Pseudomonas delhiensis]|uniref:Crotonobetainyl-CoA:carnitine CoA-transferase CaiB n=1 Tax=Pseudomonas delhiensis TaxID=366289 RepID=A0A239JSN4_9PSED|nr:CoA transferase [Pseudomonas delhiensis]SDJ97770.1 Crotonobetainyl-CoA:carnitine CoA-transferase CaiB [Pseudomonas delhiensis]SNT08850.1 Crotonobetainyl-CoA:carnitine CoA-transferase CaiB [Pseudomonas delhiensis]
MHVHALPGSLTGLKVVDLSKVLGGPYCTQILADHGADVIKVEPPNGDETRGWGAPVRERASAYFLGVNRNKRGATLNLGDAADRQRLLALLEDADVLVENYKPGTLERWGLGRQVLSERFPALIHCRISGFGDEGPYAGMPGYDAAIQAMSGLMSVNGEQDGDPLRVGVPIVDMVTGMNAALGILMALHERKLSGKGQFIEAALFDCALSILHPHSANYLYAGQAPRRSGNAHPNITPYDKFATSTGEVFLAVGNDAQFATLCRYLELPGLIEDPRFSSNQLRNRHRQALREALAEGLQRHAAEELCERLIRAGVPCGPVLDVPQALALPQVAARGMLVSIGDDYRGIASPIRLSRTPASYRAQPPGLGEHSQEVLRRRDD